MVIHQEGPLVRALFLTGLEQLVVENGADLRAMMPGCGLPVSALNKPDMLIAYRGFCTLLEHIARDCALPDLGIEWARRMSPHHANLGPLVAMAHFAGSVREWLGDILPYWAGHNNAVTIEVLPEIRPGITLLRERGTLAGPRSRQASETICASLVGILRAGVGRPDFAPARVRFSHGRPPDISAHEAFFACPVEFGCAHSGIEMTDAFLDSPTVSADEPMRSVVRKYVQHRIDAFQVFDPSFATNVSLVVGALLGSGHAGLAKTARVIGVSPKKLQRMLAAEGTSFGAVVEDLRRNIAVDLLARSNAPMGLIARFLGYSGNAPFTLAFRKWTGTSPRRWRQHNHSGARQPAP